MNSPSGENNMTLAAATYLMALGLGLTLMGAIAFQVITGRMPSLAFDDGDARAVPLAMLFRLVAGPGILVYSQLHAFLSGRGTTSNLACAALGMMWAASYGLGLGAMA